MKNLKKYITANNLFSNVFKLVLGAGVARLIGILSIPILTRIYSPEDYGVVAIFAACVAILSPILTARYVTAIPLPRNDNLAINLAYGCLFLIAIFSSIITLILYFYSEQVFNWLNIDILEDWWWLIILGSIAVAIYELLNLIATRDREYSLIAKTKITQSIFGEITKILLGLLSVKPLGLLIGNVVEQSSGIFSFYFILKKRSGNFKKNININKLYFLLKYYRNFPIFRMPSQLFLVFSTQAPAIFSAALYSTQVTGQLSLALMAIALPISIIGGSVGQVFYGEIASIGKKSSMEVKKLVYQVQKKLFLVGIPITAFIFLFGEILFEIGFGEKWSMAGKFASILAPYVLLQLTSAPLIQVLNLYNVQLGFLLINLIRTLGLVVIYLLCLNFNINEIEFVVILSSYLFIFYLFVTIYILDIVNKKSNNQTLKV